MIFILQIIFLNCFDRKKTCEHLFIIIQVNTLASQQNGYIFEIKT